MPIVEVDGIRIAYEEQGEGTPLLLLMGLGAQLILWAPPLCHRLQRRGFRVIRMDNRDVGLSERFDHLGEPPRRELVRQFFRPAPERLPYTLSHMAADAAGLLRVLGVERAHVMGVSLGGMIAQTLALEHPERVRTLTSVMSSTGKRRHLLGRPQAMRVLFQAPPRDLEEAQQREVEVFRTIGGSGFPLDERGTRALARRCWERSSQPPGSFRQLLAVVGAGDRTDRLRHLTVPTLVVHGTEDPLILPAAGEATARAIPGARLAWIPGMGHDLPRGAWPRLTDLLHEHARAHDPSLQAPGSGS